jgi:hypothetical protein
MHSRHPSDAGTGGGIAGRNGAPAVPANGRAPWSSELGSAASYAVEIGGRCIALADLLADCAASLRGATQAGERWAELVGLRDALLAGGLPAMRAAASTTTWVQFGLSYRPERHAELHGSLAATARELLARPAVRNVFFMHKPPGIRVRFEVTGAARERLVDELLERLGGWRVDGLIEQAIPGVYECEAHLFGGSVSMRSVHRLFTADSLVWLGYHALAGDAGPGPAWVASLAMLRSLFNALGVDGWEDRDVWDRVRWQTFRRLPSGCGPSMPSPAPLPGCGRSGHTLGWCWSGLRPRYAP